MNINFPLILVLLVFVSGMIILLDKFWLAKRRKTIAEQLQQQGHYEQAETAAKSSVLVEYSRSFFPIFLIVLVLRSFLFEPFRIPSGSLEPTLLVGDFVVVNKYQYGLRLPVINKKIIEISEPKVGEIAVFRWPIDPTQDYIKRVIGKSGDTISYKNKVLTINGKEVPQTLVGHASDRDAQGRLWTVEKRREMINGVEHNIFVRPDVPAHDFEVTVPQGMFFMMGDNRDDSADSRHWGFVPEKALIGRAARVWLSWNSVNDSVRWNRIGMRIV